MRQLIVALAFVATVYLVVLQFGNIVLYPKGKDTYVSIQCTSEPESESLYKIRYGDKFASAKASVVPVFCVSCTTNNECTASTSCTGSSSPICQHPDGAGIVTGGGLCTCKDSSCILKEECYGNSANLNCTDDSRHCFDGSCICDRFPIGRK